MTSKSKTSETQDEYNEEVRRQVVAAAFGPVLDDLLAEAKPQAWPKIWSPTEELKLNFTRLKYPKGYKTDCDKRKCGIPADSKFQEPVDLKASLHNFRVYVNDTEYFMSNLPPVYSKWSSGKVFNEHGLNDIRKTNFDYKNEPYFAMICGAYIASYLSGISLLNLSETPATATNTSKLITSFVRYHFCEIPSNKEVYASSKTYTPIRSEQSEEAHPNCVRGKGICGNG